MKAQKKLSTFYAPAGRSSLEQLANERSTIYADEIAGSLMDAMPEPAMILNKHRQIVAVNRSLLDVLGIASPDFFIGLRPGEAFDCIHQNDGPDGCGTSPNCSVCGAVITILTCIKTSQPSRGECQMTVHKDRAVGLDLEVVVTPLSLGNEEFIVCAIKDISAEKRKMVMERTFFHDILNAAGGVRGFASLLVEVEGLPKDTEQEYKKWMLTLSDNLIDDIMHQKCLLAAEKGEYSPHLEKIDITKMVTELGELFVHHEKVPGREIHQETISTTHIVTDPPILRRIVGNMLINALEATPKGGAVAIRCGCKDGTVRIEVENPGEIPRDIQYRIFKRSFSTKSAHGRGIGTYSIKLFGEHYLGGEVGFTSGNGRTVFYIELPSKQSNR